MLEGGDFLAKAKSKEVRVTGPTLCINGKDVVSFATKFTAPTSETFSQKELSDLSLKLHNEFTAMVVASIGEKEEEIFSEEN
jgi:hypothetical protein